MNFFFSGLPGAPHDWERKMFTVPEHAIVHATQLGWTFVHTELEGKLVEVWSLFDGPTYVLAQNELGLP